MRLHCSSTMRASLAFLVVAVLQLSGARIGVDPPKKANMCTCASAHDSSSVL